MKKRGFTAFLFRLGVIAITVLFLSVVVDFVRFPECYLTTWRYQLQNAIADGNAQAIEYYENTYLANGKILFD